MLVLYSLEELVGGGGLASVAQLAGARETLPGLGHR